MLSQLTCDLFHYQDIPHFPISCNLFWGGLGLKKKKVTAILQLRRVMLASLSRKWLLWRMVCVAIYLTEASLLFKPCPPETPPQKLQECHNLEMATLVIPGPKVSLLNGQNRPGKGSVSPLVTFTGRNMP